MQPQPSRRGFLEGTSAAAALVGLLDPAQAADTVDNAAPAVNGATDGKTFSAAWSAVDGFTDEAFISFNAEAYTAMVNDPRRTPKFRQAIERRVAAHSGGPLVAMDLGTGPIALLALIAARAGADKVYAIESNPAVAALARQAVAAARDVKAGTVVIVEGLSTAITLPEKVDLVLAEVVGSVASEEGLVATMADARARHVKRPDDPNSYIPARVQTWCAPAAYSPHLLLAPPEVDWSKLGGDPVRLNCRDKSVQLLAEPQLFEDIKLYDPKPFAALQTLAKPPNPLVFTVSDKRVAAAAQQFEKDFLADATGVTERAVLARYPKPAVVSGAAAGQALAREASGAFSGLALWPKLVLDVGPGGTVGDDLVTRTPASGLAPLVVESRGPSGEAQKSHWTTVVALASARPLNVKPGDTVSVDATVDFSSARVDVPVKYAFTGKLA